MGNLTKQLTVLIGSVTFLLIGFLGIIGEVSWGVIFIRAITASLVVSLMTYLAIFLILNVVIKEHQLKESELNLMVDDEINLDELIDPTEEQPGNTDSQTETIKPFVPNRFDNADIENIIKDDPIRAAEVLRRMGLDD